MGRPYVGGIHCCGPAARSRHDAERLVAATGPFAKLRKSVATLFARITSALRGRP